MTAKFKVTGTEMTPLGLAKKYEVETFFHSGSLVSASDKKISAAFKIIFEMKGTTKIAKAKAIRKAGIDLSLEEWQVIFKRYSLELES
jgi:hypothetical protein